MVRILAFETSCDETAVAIVRDGRFLEANQVASQTELHRRSGGVVPEQASRAHLTALLPVLERAFEQAGVGWEDLDAVAVTSGPGLAGALLVGVNAAKALAFARGLPLLGIHHLEGHVYANWIITDQAAPEEPRFPLVCLIVSGGHSEIVVMRGHGDFERLGRTRDDAAGEAFDKVARILGLGFPGGPAIQKAAERGDPTRYPLPRAWLKGTFDFSFSGLKTAVLHLVEQVGEPLPVADIAAAFQESVVDVLATKTVEAARQVGAAEIALAGGVAANLPLRQRVRELSPVPVRIPPVWLCTDNAAMIGAAAYYRFMAGCRSGLDLDVTPNWPIERAAEACRSG
jgi:N6-L-threonylcarbamoyladenine synthase